jgi:formylglycine-generating enzyme required for sulfatase activity
MTGLTAGGIILFQFGRRQTTERIADKQSTMAPGRSRQENAGQSVEKVQPAEGVVAEIKPEGIQEVEKAGEKMAAERADESGEAVENVAAELNRLEEEKEKQLELERQKLISEKKASLAKAVLEAKVEMGTAFTAARDADAAQYAPSQYASAELERRKAEDFEKSDDGERARVVYAKATEEYLKAETEARKAQAAREAAIVAMRAMEKSRADTEGEDEQLQAEPLWQTGEQERRKGNDLFGLQEYASAMESFEKAQALYIEARKKSQAKLKQLARQERARERRKAEADLIKKGLEAAKAHAEEQQAVEYAKESYDLAQQKLQEGNKTYEAQDFLAAAELYEEATSSFQESAEKARAAKAFPEGLALRDGKIISLKDGAEMVRIPAGEFIMGASDEAAESDERPPHRVRLDAFYVDRYEVTNAQFCEFLNERGVVDGDLNILLEIENEDCLIVSEEGRFVPRQGHANHPAVCLTWHGANAYAEWADKRLPTEAEWEYACRAGTAEEFHLGDTADHDIANLAGTNGRDIWEKTAPVGSFASNEWGLFDMHGNVLEWCSDWYDEKYYEISPDHNPAGPPGGSQRVARGASWIQDILAEIRSSYRNYHPPNRSAASLGFRCVRDLE